PAMRLLIREVLVQQGIRRRERARHRCRLRDPGAQRRGVGACPRPARLRRLADLVGAPGLRRPRGARGAGRPVPRGTPRQARKGREPWCPFMSCILIVGLGSIGRRHLGNLRTLGYPDVVLCRTGKGPAGAAPIEGYRSEPSLAAALSHRPIATIVSNPTALHVETAILA